MATRAEDFHAEQQRHGQRKKKLTKPSRPGVPEELRSRSKKHAAKKASYALEAPMRGPRSRKSTRKSANRAKPDTSFNLREEMTKGSPEGGYRKAKARTIKVRGKA